MKNLLLFLFLTGTAFGQAIFPRLITFPQQAQLSINNYTQQDQRCSGSIFIYHMSGRFETRFYSNTLYRGMSDYEYYYNFNITDPFRNAHHSISCYAY